MEFRYAITIRSQPGKHADCGHALERVAFFPGVVAAGVIQVAANSITIGYNGHPQPKTRRELHADLSAEGLIADGFLWGTETPPDSHPPRAFVTSPRDRRAY
jgi:hypothetical protein